MNIVELQPMLLSLIPPSCMVVTGRDLVNTLLFLSVNCQSNQITSFIHLQIYININITRGQSLFLSSNCFRELSIHSNALSMDYTEKV